MHGSGGGEYEGINWDESNKGSEPDVQAHGSPPDISDSEVQASPAHQVDDADIPGPNNRESAQCTPPL
eukprot:3037321-Pyramimonas_sp.AAC.1